MKENGINNSSLQIQNNPENQSRCNGENLTLRLNKIEGQIRGISKMVNQKVYCDDVLIQIVAAQSALYSVGRLILENHIQLCLKDKIGAVDDQTIDDLFVSIYRLHKIGN